MPCIKSRKWRHEKRPSLLSLCSLLLCSSVIIDIMLSFTIIVLSICSKSWKYVQFLHCFVWSFYFFMHGGGEWGCWILILITNMFLAMSNSSKLVFSSGISQSYTTQREKKLSGYGSNNQRFVDRNTESQAMLANQVDPHSYESQCCLVCGTQTYYLSNFYLSLVFVNHCVGSHYSAFWTNFISQWSDGWVYSSHWGVELKVKLQEEFSQPTEHKSPIRNV